MKHSAQDVRRIVSHSILLQKVHEFLFETPLFMMLPLISNIANDICRLRCAHAEGSVSFLPCEALVAGSRFIDPMGGTSFEELDSFCQRQGRRQCEEGVDMIAYAADD